MPRLRIRHRTELRYDGVATESVNEVRMLPRPGPLLRVEAATVMVTPNGQLRTHTDAFGNSVVWFQIVEPHQCLVVEAEATVEVLEPLSPVLGAATVGQWGALADPSYRDEMTEFLVPSTFTGDGDDLTALSADLALAEDGGVARWVEDLAHAVARAIAYETGATTVDTSALEVARLRRGVCQDLAHVSIALCRRRGIPARYISGWLHYPGADGPGESHAWIEAHVPGEGWMAIDPTHPGRSDIDHVPVAMGRDYADVPPIRGSYLGAPATTMSVWVDIREQPALSPPRPAESEALPPR
jgi:transglutaminase-like putative cysteine protease